MQAAMSESKKLTVKEVSELKGAARATVSRWCRRGLFPNAEKIVSPTGEEYWLIPEEELGLIEVKMGRPKKKD